SEMGAAYAEGMAAAIVGAGFQCFRMERQGQSNRSDGEIIGGIRRSRVMIADFTCGKFEFDGKLYADSRGGVYYEAGFAQGLGRVDKRLQP
ncbi:hypothetical protein, partial [Sphingomonas koreensis]|uniref:hypothetical protein n=1 Tax=Sphingomonas koreensis TaxID=93064 RepID=UPI0019D0F3BC